MDGTITTIYCLCDDFLKAINRRPDDPQQVRLTTAEVMTVPLVAATFFDANVEKTRRFRHKNGPKYAPRYIVGAGIRASDATGFGTETREDPPDNNEDNDRHARLPR